MYIILVVLSGVLLAAGGMMYSPIMPIQASELGAPSWVMTAIPMALPSIVALVLLLPIAAYADSTGRRKELLLVVAIIVALADVCLGLFSDSWIALTVFRTIAGLAFAFATMFAVIIALLLPEEKRGLAMALGMGGPMLGMGVSQIVSGTVLKMLGSYTNLYYLTAALSILAFLLLLPVKVPQVKSPTSISGKDFKKVMTNKSIVITLIGLTVYVTGWNMLYGSFPVVTVKFFGVPVELQSALFGIASAMLGFGTIIWGPVINKWGGKRALLLGISMSAIATLIMAAVPQLWPYVVLFFISTAGGVVGAPASGTIATLSVKKELVTVATNTMFMGPTLAGIIGGFTAGPVIAAAGLVGFLLVSAALQIIGDITLLMLPEPQKTQKT